MKIAIFGATSQIAKDLVISFFENTDFECVLFSRDVLKVEKQFRDLGIKISYLNLTYDSFSKDDTYDLIINFVGVGNPADAIKMGSDIFEITEYYDNLALSYLKAHLSCQYIFISSGAVYGGNFETPVNENTKATIDINNLKETDWYAVSKIYSEARHRALKGSSIVDVRVFNYFSHTIDINSGFMIAEMIRAIKTKNVFLTTTENIVRDFLTPLDFFNLIMVIINFRELINLSIDCYSRSPIDKLSLLGELSKQFGLRFGFEDSIKFVNATGSKLNYFSNNRVAMQLGYRPLNTSKSGILSEISLLNIDSE